MASNESCFIEDTIKAFNIIKKTAVDNNCEFDRPEFVFIGPKEGGKTSVLESIFRHRFIDPTTTKRPIEIRVVNDPDAEAPTVTILRDSATKSLKKDLRDLELSAVPAAIQSALMDCVDYTAIPLRVIYK